MTDFEEVFQQYKEACIALYGLGTETERVLSEAGREYRIVGLLDSFREDGNLYGKPILSLSACLKERVELVIVVARPGSCRAIAKKIGTFCKQNNITLLDIRGRDLCVQNRVLYDFRELQGMTKAELLDRALKADVISFDLFDTLIMRQVLSPLDVIRLTEVALKEKNISIDDFSQKRQQAEKILSVHQAPDLKEIYQYVLGQLKGEEFDAEELADTEWTTDCALVMPRHDMVEFMNELYRAGKDIYIVTDSYYNRDQIKELLEQCGVTAYKGVFVSCEYHKGKTQGLFSLLQDAAPNRNILHIGDDLTADIESAAGYGIEACRINSAFDLLEHLGFLGMWEQVGRLSSDIKIGMFVARLLNSPFVFEKNQGMLTISSAYDIGYLLLAPMITDFTFWLRETVDKEKIENVWLGARDGYLIKKLFDMLHGREASTYFLTSRTAAIRAGMETTADIEYVSGMKYAGDLRKQLKERFGFNIRDVIDGTGHTVADYSDEILTQAKVYRQHYERYMQSLPVKAGNIAFFDFVAKGTTQLYISRLTDRHIKGFYFLQLEKEFMKNKNLDITAFYDDVEMSSIYEDYYVLETILTSPDPSITGFDEFGNAVFASETRTTKDLQCVEAVQKGIIDYFKLYLQITASLKNCVEKKTDELFLNLTHRLQIESRDFLDLKVEDPFFNRMTEMTDLI